MKILFDVDHSFTYCHGGVQVLVENIMKHLPEFGVEVEPLRWWEKKQSAAILQLFYNPTPTALFAKNFMKRHLMPGGKILASTPNPFCYYFVARLFSKGTFVANFYHSSWISPSNALGIANRCNLQRSQYCVFDGSKIIIKKLIKKLLPAEFKYITHVYEFMHQTP